MIRNERVREIGGCLLEAFSGEANERALEGSQMIKWREGRTIELNG